MRRNSCGLPPPAPCRPRREALTSQTSDTNGAHRSPSNQKLHGLRRPRERIRGIYSFPVGRSDPRRQSASGARDRIRSHSARRAGDRPDARHRILFLPGRPPAGLDRAGLGRHRPAHRSARQERGHAPVLDRDGADQRHGRADRAPAGRAAFPTGRLGRHLARSRRRRASPPSRRARAFRPSARTAPMPTCSASRSIRARRSPMSRNCARPTCRSSICGSPTPTRTG